MLKEQQDSHEILQHVPVNPNLTVILLILPMQQIEFPSCKYQSRTWVAASTVLGTSSSCSNSSCDNFDHVDVSYIA